MKRFLVSTGAASATRTSRSPTTGVGEYDRSSGAKRMRRGDQDASIASTRSTRGLSTADAATRPSQPRSRKISTHADLDVLYYPKFLPDGSIRGCGLASLPLEQTSIIMFGKRIKEPRLTGYFGTKALKYSGSVRNPKPFTDELNDIREKIEALPEVRRALEMDIPHATTGAEISSRCMPSDRPAHHSFNGCLANLYVDGSHYMGFHRDDEPENGPSRANRVIASVTLGESRRFVFKRDSDGAKVEMNLEPGSLLLMKGRTQSLWKHSVPKTSKSVGKRLNLTFRVII